MKKVTIFKSVLWAILGFALASGITRMLFGLGSITNQSDATPWGIWKGMNVIPGIALAAGGFVVTAVIYIFRRHEYARYSRVAVLLAFLGYLSAATALVVELGLPWMVWHPVIYWQHHSALFEVSWCVILYLMVLFLEFIPVPLEETGWFPKVKNFLIKYKLVLVILGVMISTLHQSSLGTMFLITPEKLHPLWYSSLLPILFFISAVAVGPLMVILAVLTISTLYNKVIEKEKLAKLALASAIILTIFSVIRLVDMGIHGKFGIAFSGSWQSAIFWIEMLLVFFIPVISLAFKKMRYSTGALWMATISAVLGIGLHRANIAGIMLTQTGATYTPTIFEISISLGILSAAILAFLFCVERFKLWEVKWEDPREGLESKPQFDRAGEVWLGTPHIANRTVFSAVLIVTFAVSLAIIPYNRIKSEGVVKVDVREALGSVMEGDTLIIDGNRDGYAVKFDHNYHAYNDSLKITCGICHHMNMPLDKTSGCYSCHREMYTPVDAFKHDWHASPSGAKLSCTQCHPDGERKLADNAKDCSECHKDLIPTDATIKVESYDALSYADAMHGVCVECHKTEAAKSEDRAKLGQCESCHSAERIMTVEGNAIGLDMDKAFGSVVLPENEMEESVEPAKEVTDE